MSHSPGMKFLVPLLFGLYLCGVKAAEPSAPPKYFPAGEKVISLFNGKDLSGWEGQIGQRWSVEDGVIRGANKTKVGASTYLFTRRNYRNFRLIFQVKQIRSEKLSTMHSAVAVLGEKMEDQGDPFSFKGPLLMFGGDWGIWDAHRRNRVFPPAHKGQWLHPSEKVGDWNLIEILVTGDRIQMAANGRLVFDFKDEPQLLKESPIGLQLHSNDRPQEFHFRELHLSESPSDKLATLEPTHP